MFTCCLIFCWDVLIIIGRVENSTNQFVPSALETARSLSTHCFSEHLLQKEALLKGLALLWQKKKEYDELPSNVLFVDVHIIQLKISPKIYTIAYCLGCDQRIQLRLLPRTNWKQVLRQYWKQDILLWATETRFARLGKPSNNKQRVEPKDLIGNAK